MVGQTASRRANCIWRETVWVGRDDVLHGALPKTGFHKDYKARAFGLAASTSSHEGNLAITLDRIHAMLRLQTFAGLLVSAAVE